MYEPSSLNNHSKEFKEERKGKKKKSSKSGEKFLNIYSQIRFNSDM